MSLKKLVAIDFETNGLDTKRAEIIEVGAVIVRPGKIEEISWLVQTKVSEITGEITGITQGDLYSKGIKYIRSIARLSWLLEDEGEGLLVIGHNLLGFEEPIIRRVLRGKRAILRLDEVYDTGAEYLRRKLYIEKPGPPALAQQEALSRYTSESWNLGHCCRTTPGVKSMPSHRALPDAKATLDLYSKLEPVKWGLYGVSI